MAAILQTSTAEAQAPCNCRTCRRAQKWERWTRNVDAGLQKVAGAANAQSTRLGCESFAPGALGEECLKATRILTQFSTAPAPTKTKTEGGAMQTTKPAHHPIHIPQSTLESAIAVAVFTTGRLGLGHISASSGSGLLIRRNQSDGKWGYPSAIRTVSFGAGPLAAGAEVSDRVYTIHTTEALELFLNGQFHLGPEAVLALGPHGGGAGLSFSGRWPAKKPALRERIAAMRGLAAHTSSNQAQEKSNNEARQQGAAEINEKAAVVDVQEFELVNEKDPLLAKEIETSAPPTNTKSRDNAAHHNPAHRDAIDNLRESLQQPVYCYMRSAGLYAGLQGEGTVILDRADANEEFYGRAVFAPEQEGAQNMTVALSEEKQAAVEGLWRALGRGEGHA
jgi:lipid-binding SYLF domain-containing protein